MPFVAIGRITHQIELQEMLQRHEIGQIDHEAKLIEARLRSMAARHKLEESLNPSKPKSLSGADAIIAEELAEIDAMVSALVTKSDKIQDLERDPRFQRLTEEERKTVIDRIEARLDAAEVSARREMRGT
jgi:hypothetical protein